MRSLRLLWSLLLGLGLTLALLWALTPRSIVEAQNPHSESGAPQASRDGAPAAPELSIDKWNTPGVARPGGTYLYGIYYSNDGDGVAENTTITDTLPPSTTYAVDTSGFTVIDGGGVITWELNDVLPGTYGRFYVALDVDPAVLTQTHLAPNCVRISTTSPGDTDPGNDQSCSGEQWVDEGQMGVGVNKGPGPDDPHPGQEFAYYVDYGTDGGGATGPVRLTDTLPLSTTLVGWEAEEEDWEALWTEVITTGGLFVLEAPAGIPGDMGGRIRLTLFLEPDVPIGTVLENTVVITTAGDVDPGNNQHTNTDARVSAPRYDMRVDKNFGGGILVPGGELGYGINYENRGNMATHAWLTDTLPPGTAYQPDSAGHGDRGGWEPFPPAIVTADYVVWDLGVVGVNEGFDFDFRLNISPTVAPGAVLTNCVSVGITATEHTAWDNVDCTATTVYTAGLPNLYVIKENRDYRPGNGNIGYRVNFGNYSDQTLYNVHLTDTFPISTTSYPWEHWPGVDYHRAVTVTSNYTASQWLFLIEELGPGDQGSIDFNVSLDDPNERMRWYTNTVEIDTPPDDANLYDNSDVDAVYSGGEVDRAEMWVGTDHSDMWGQAQPGAAVTVTTLYAQENAWADPDCGGCWDIGDVGSIYPGDIITVEAGAGVLPVIFSVPGPFSAEADSKTDQVWGQIGGAANEMLQVHGYWPGGYQDVLLDASGYYTATYTDVPRGGDGHVRYQTQIDYADVVFHRGFRTPDLLLSVGYGGDWVEGGYEPGHTVWITVTESDGSTLKATAELTTGQVPGWDGQTGFATDWQGWSGARPDIQAGDWVYALVDNGYTGTLHIGSIEGYVDAAADTITGTVDAAPWLTQTVEVECHSWGAPGWAPNKHDTVLPDGEDIYACSWDPGSEWDVEPGRDVGVSYDEPDGDRVYNSFREPAADVAVDKNGHSQPAPGGNYMYTINYHNHGDALASGVVLTDVLPTGMSYITDTSGIAPSDLGGVVVWDLGSVEGNSHESFDVFVGVSPGLTPGDVVTNAVQIDSPDFDMDPGNNGHEWWTDVLTNETDLNVGKWSWTGDPAAGTEFIYTVNVCNNGGSGSSEAVLTDTLHPSTTLQAWWGQHPGWTQIISSSNQLVVSRPSLPGWWCSEVYLRVHVDGAAWPGMPISNTAVITAGNDVDGNNNEDTWWGDVGEPHTNLSINKNWNGGQLVPGGELRYWIDYDNNGNLPVTDTIRITDTLPVSTTFVESWHHRPFQPPTRITPTLGAGYVVWEVGTLENGWSGNIEAVLAVDGDAHPGTELVNRVEIGPQPDEDNYDDNVDRVATTVYTAGLPNLYVTKESRDYRPGNGNIDYRINFGNYSDQTLYNVHLTDTFPISTTSYPWEHWPGVDYHRAITVTSNYTASQWLFLIEELGPGDQGSIDFNVNLDDPNAPLHWYTNTVEIDTPPGDANPYDNDDVDVAFSGGEVQWLDLDVGAAHIWGCVPNLPITITTPFGQRGIGDACFDEWLGEPFQPFQPGDVVTVTAGAGLHPVVIEIPDPFDAYASSITDTVWGRIDTLYREWVDVDLSGEGRVSTQTDDSGNYSVTFPDVPRGGDGEVRYHAEIDYAGVTFHRGFRTPDLFLNVNYGDDWIDGGYEPGHTVWITVTESDGSTIRATAELTTGQVPGWGGGTGFATNWQGWSGAWPDIQAGDWVYGEVDNGYTGTLHIGSIEGFVDAAADTITGTIDAAPWLTETVEVECHPWGAPGWAPNPENKHDTVLPNGEDIYTCSWDPGSEWDVEPGRDVGVSYDEPDGDRVYNSFHEPAADVAVDKNGHSQPAPGGNYMYTINYHNQGGALASGVVLTDVLPAGMSYITDTSGIAPSVSGGLVVWDLGSVDGNSDGSFDVFVGVDAGLTPGTVVTNAVQIHSPDFDMDPGNNGHEWWTEVLTNETDLNVGKWSWTGDPAPGTDFIYSVNVCNDGATASGEVVLTDTLHPSTTLQTWWGQHPGWTQIISSSNQLVVSRPSLPGWWCSEVYLRVRLDGAAWPGMPISNTAVITASNDVEGNDNETTWPGNVGEPYTNLSINKNWSSGQLVPGGELRYWIDYGNNGNLPVTDTIRITDTLPVSTTFVESWHHRRFEPPTRITPTIGAGYVVWEVGTLENGWSGNIEVVLAVEGDAHPGTELVNVVEISPQPDEDNYDDNVSKWVETLYDHGLNLRVRKRGGWNGGDENTRQARYDVAVENIGDVRVDHVTITDTYPISMSLDGGIDTDSESLEDWYDDPASRTFTATYWSLSPGDSMWLNFGAIVSGTGPLPFGLLFTNTVEVLLDPGDINPADNVDQAVLTTGPDLWVEKSLAAGDLLPGEIVTFSLVFGNDRAGHEWWWDMQGDASITDTLPAGLEFITATLQSDGWNPFPPDVQNSTQLVWNVGQLPAGHKDEIYLTVRVTDTVEDDDVFSNWVEIASDQPVSDTEPIYANNADDEDLVFALPGFQVGKVHESSGVAGTVVTYTLTVTNSGSAPGTNVVLSDTLPTGLIYGGGGGFDGTAVTWTLASVGPYTGSAAAWFSATLPCTGTVINDDYRVVGSDERMTSDVGASRTLTVAAPAIITGLAYTPGAIVVSDTVQFTATASTDGTPLSYVWDFGDGPVGGGLTASRVYTQEGAYAVILTATDSCGYSDVAMDTVVVNPPTLVAGFDQSATSVVVNATVAFTDTSTTDGPAITAWLWDFGDGSPAAATPDAQHAYLQPGTFTVTLTVTDALGYADSVTGNVTVNPPTLAAGFDQSATSVVVDATVAFIDTSTTNGPAITGWLWDFGDGSPTVATQNAQHAYLQAGTFTVTLTVTDALGYGDEATGSVVVNPPTLLTAFSQSATSVVVDAIVAFTDTSTTNGPAITSWLWDFGDGSALVATQNAQHAYLQAGTFTVTLTVTDALGYGDEATGNVVVNPPALVAAFDQSATSVVVDAIVAFTDTSATDGPAITQWLWTFGDGESSTAQHTSHAYTAIGTYTVSLVVTDALGYSDRASVTVYVVEGTQVTLDPDTGGTLVFTDTQGNTTVIQVPPGAVSEAVVLRYTPLHTVTTTPANFAFAGHVFDLDAYRGAQRIAGFQFSKPVTMTIRYSDDDVAGLNEHTLALYYWDGLTSQWLDAAQTCTPASSYDRHPDANWLALPICHLSKFGVFAAKAPQAPTEYMLYLPLVMNAGP